MKINFLKKIYITFIIFYLSLIYAKDSMEKMKPLFECSVDKTEPIPKLAKNISPIKNSNYKRILDGDGFKEFNIYLDLNNFEYEVNLYNLNNKKELFLSGMRKAINTTKTLLKVKPIKNYKFTDSQILEENIYKWNTTKIGSNATQGLLELGIDLYIFVRFGNKTEMGELSLASASARYLDDETGQPIIGIININKDVDYSKENSYQFFEMIIMHEFTHVLGFSSHFFTTYFNNILVKNDSFGIRRAYINSSRVVNVGKKYFNCETLEGVELEDFGGSETSRSHWEARILLGEYMNGVAYNEEVVISEFTLALLEDSGYYKVNYYTGGLMQYGKNKGCDFLNQKCVNNGKVNPNFKNEFFDNTFYSSFDPSCSSGRQSRAYHGVYLYGSIPEEYQYYSNNSYGGRSSADYCPVSQEYNYEAKNIYYVGHCSEKGSGEYGSRIPYKNNEIKYYKSSDIKQITMEYNSENSFCVLSSLISKTISNYNLYSNTVRAICYQMFCSERSLTILINNNYFVCPRAGGKINGTNFDGFLLCPDYYLICSGTVLCNDMFGCVAKKSLLKTNITYDYTIKTSQDIKDAQNETFSSDAYELSDNGICPKYCSQCNRDNNCIKCSYFAGIYQFNEDGITKRICKLLTELETSYYMHEGIYYKCMDNCNKCTNGSECIECNSDYININKKCSKKIINCSNYDNKGKCTKCNKGYKVSNNGTLCERGIEKCLNYTYNTYNCTKCEDSYVLFNNQCNKEIEKCEIYEDEQNCQKCMEGFAFEGNNRTKCYNVYNFTEGYYSKDNKISFYKCDGDNIENIKNCRLCNYINELICKECKQYYVLKDNESNICYPNQTFVDDKKYYYENRTHVKTCSKNISNCETCAKSSGQVICNKCENNYSLNNNNCYKTIVNCQIYEANGDCKKGINGYAFEGNNKQICKKNNTFEEYFTKDNGLSYFRCNDTSNGGINNCHKCKYNNNEVNCYECKNDYVFKDDVKNICYLRSEFNNNNKYYYENYTHIRSCNKTLKNCDECEKRNDKIICNKCLTNFYFVNDNNIRNCTRKDLIIPVDEYYFDNYTKEYYSCRGKNHQIKNCQKCTNSSVCNACQNGYEFIKNNSKLICKNKAELGQKYIIDEIDASGNNIYKKCSDFLFNCDTCPSKNVCLSCIENYGLYNDKKTCININNQYHYKNISNNLYYLCNTTMQYCEKCLSKNDCKKCIYNYIKINNDRTTCHPITKINISEYYIDPNDDNMYLKCSSFINKCVSCEYKQGCKLCEKGYILLNDDTKTCYNKASTNLKSYFTEDNITYYSCNDYKYKNNIQCFSLVPQQNISLTFLQVQIINNKLVCFMITHSPLPKNFSLKVVIMIISSIRNLEEKEVILTSNDDSNGSTNTFVSFSSEEEFDNSVDVEINDISFDNGNNITKTVTDNNKCSINFDKTSELINTGKVKKLIGEKKIPDCSLINSGDIVTLKMDKIKDCEINLKSNQTVSFSDNQFNLELIEYDNKENIITAECDTKKNDIEDIQCTINDKVTKTYSLKEKIIPLSDKYIAISTEKEKFNISCQNKTDFQKILIIIGLIPAAIILISIISCFCACCCCKKQKTKSNINILPTNNSNMQDYKNEIYMYNQKNNSKSFRSGFNSGLRLN